jgi:hypothetical protein
VGGGGERLFSPYLTTTLEGAEGWVPLCLVINCRDCLTSSERSVIICPTQRDGKEAVGAYFEMPFCNSPLMSKQIREESG